MENTDPEINPYYPIEPIDHISKREIMSSSVQLFFHKLSDLTIRVFVLGRGSMLDLESRGPGSIPTRGGVIFCFKFYNPNLHNTARSDRIRFKTKNPIKLIGWCTFYLVHVALPV